MFWKYGNVIFKVLKREDVYVVTMSQAIDWMERPTRLQKIKGFTPWQCRYRVNEHVHPCEVNCGNDDYFYLKNIFRILLCVRIRLKMNPAYLIHSEYVVAVLESTLGFMIQPELEDNDNVLEPKYLKWSNAGAFIMLLFVRACWIIKFFVHILVIKKLEF